MSVVLLVPEALTQLVAPWSRYYGHSTATSTAITFLHLGALVVGGGLAIALDRGTLHPQADPDPAEGAVAPHASLQRARRRHLVALRRAHRLVIPSLAIAMSTGIAMLAADVESYLPSRIFWLKMTLLVLLLANGALMGRTEAQLAVAGADEERHWRRLRHTAATSIALWLALTLAGVALRSAV